LWSQSWSRRLCGEWVGGWVGEAANRCSSRPCSLTPARLKARRDRSFLSARLELGSARPVRFLYPSHGSRRLVLVRQQTASHDQRSDWRLFQTTLPTRNISLFVRYFGRIKRLLSRLGRTTTTSHYPIAAYDARTIEDDILNSFYSVLTFRHRELTYEAHIAAPR
jgi:hypothetical protein